MAKQSNPKIFIKDKEGFVVLMVAFFVMIIMLSMAISMNFLTVNLQKKATNTVRSTQSHYAAESGVEDALLRLRRNPLMSYLEYDLIVNGATAGIVIPDTVGPSKTIVSRAINGGMVRETQATCSINGLDTSFYYAIAVGEGGLTMGNGSRVVGNVFSAGNISGSGIIDNNVVVSGTGHSIQGVYVGGDVLAYSCLSPASVRNLTYVNGGVKTCTVRGTLNKQDQEIVSRPLPIPESKIEEWKNEATSGGVFPGNMTISSSQSLGPKKITGNLILNNNVIITLTGTVYVQGNIAFGNGSGIKMSSSYIVPGGVVLAGGTITTGNTNTFSGSGQPGSYLLIISTSTSDSAITVSNNSSGAVFYTSAGGLRISNNVSVVEATGYKVIMENNSKIEYSSGIVNIFFSSGPAGGWEVTNWREY